MYAVELDNVSFQYENTEIDSLKNIHLQIKQGEFVLITGMSGCGKTTLTRCINGLVPHFYEGNLQGEVRLGGVATTSLPMYEISKTIGSVFQDPRSQFFTTNTTDEVAFGCENLGLSRDEINKRSADAFAELSLSGLQDRSIFEMSSGEKQKIALASAYAMRPQIFVLDEPSANLDNRSTRQLADLLSTLKNQGHTIIISEHRLHYLLDLCDRVLYMKDGCIGQEWTPAQAKAMHGETLWELGLRLFCLNNPCYDNRAGQPIENTCEPVLSVFDLKVDVAGKSILTGLSFNAAWTPGEIIGIIGSNGVGKTTLVKTLCGLIKEKNGNILWNGAELSPKSRPAKSYFVMQDADYQLFTNSVKNELRFANKGLSDEKIDAALDALGLLSYKKSHPMILSGGQKQRLCIAVAMLSNAEILFFDEPTSGLDGGNMRNVGGIMQRLSQEGKMVFVISHDYEFLANYCSSILYLSDGKIQEKFSVTDESANKLSGLLEM